MYCAKDTRLGREVALKVLPESFARDADRLRRFEQEARAVAALNHPNILAIHDIGEQNGTAFLSPDGKWAIIRLPGDPAGHVQIVPLDPGRGRVHPTAAGWSSHTARSWGSFTAATR